MGAIGIARCLYFNGARGSKIYDSNVPLNPDLHDPHKMNVSAIHHFYDKLLKLKDTMNTETGKQIAEMRHKTMEIYLEIFFKEWDGKL